MKLVMADSILAPAGSPSDGLGGAVVDELLRVLKSVGVCAVDARALVPRLLVLLLALEHTVAQHGQQDHDGHCQQHSDDHFSS